MRLKYNKQTYTPIYTLIYNCFKMVEAYRRNILRSLNLINHVYFNNCQRSSVNSLLPFLDSIDIKEIFPNFQSSIKFLESSFLCLEDIYILWTLWSLNLVSTVPLIKSSRGCISSNQATFHAIQQRDVYNKLWRAFDAKRTILANVGIVQIVFASKF